MNPAGRQKQKKLGLLAGALFAFFSKKPPQKKLNELEFSTSTQRMGLHFSERIRRFFRHRWFFIQR